MGRGEASYESVLDAVTRESFDDFSALIEAEQHAAAATRSAEALEAVKGNRPVEVLRFLTNERHLLRREPVSSVSAKRSGGGMIVPGRLYK